MTHATAQLETALAGDASRLASAESGCARILWFDLSGSYPAVHWAVVRIAGGGGGGTTIKWGKLIANWVSGNTVTVTPCNGPSDGTPISGASPCTVYLVCPRTATPTGFLLNANDIIGYVETATNEGQALPCKRISPTGQYQVRQGSSTLGEMYDWVRAHG